MRPSPLFADICGLSFQAEIGSESLLAIDLLLRLDSDELKALPVDGAVRFCADCMAWGP